MIKKYYIDSPKTGYAYDRNAKRYYSWGFDIRLDGRREQQRGFATRSDAEAAVTELRKLAREGKRGYNSAGNIPKLIELFQKKLNSMETGHDRTRARRVYKYFLKLLPPKIRVVDVKTAHLQLYVEARTKEGVSAQTIRRELVPIVSALKSAYTFFASLDDYRHPRVPRPRVIKSRKERVISQAEQDRLFEYFFAPPKDDEIRQEPQTRRRTGQFLLFCLLSLSRPGEIAALKRTDIDLDSGIVSITGRKSRFTSTQIVRRLKISSTMRDILEERLELADGDHLFTKAGYVTPKMCEQLKKACEYAGIKYGRIDREGISFHTARHTGITMLVQSGMDLKTIGKLAGHSDSQMTLYYTHASADLVNQAADILERKMGRKLGQFSSAR